MSPVEALRTVEAIDLPSEAAGVSRSRQGQLFVGGLEPRSDSAVVHSGDLSRVTRGKM